jgi:hypothetical protein
MAQQKLILEKLEKEKEIEKKKKEEAVKKAIEAFKIK